MKNKLMFLTGLSFAAIATGCAYSVHEVHVSDFSPYAKSGRRIASSADQFAIMGFVNDTDYVDKAYKALKQKCPNGEIVGITTEYQTALGFFSWHNKIFMKGRCVEGTKA